MLFQSQISPKCDRLSVSSLPEPGPWDEHVFNTCPGFNNNEQALEDAAGGFAVLPVLLQYYSSIVWLRQPRDCSESGRGPVVSAPSILQDRIAGSTGSLFEWHSSI